MQKNTQVRFEKKAKNRKFHLKALFRDFKDAEMQMKELVQITKT